MRIAEARIPEPPDFPPDWLWSALGIGIAIALVLLALARMRAYAWARASFALISATLSLALGFGGLVLLALWTLTDHISAWRNENLLLFDPLCLLLLPAWLGALRKNWRPSLFAERVAFVIAALAGLALFLKVFPAFAQDNRMWIALLLPVHVALAFALMHSRKQSA